MKYFSLAVYLVSTVLIIIASNNMVSIGMPSIPSLNKGIEISISEKKANSVNGIVKYNVTVQEPGLYNIRLWQCATQKKDKTYVPYKIVLNDTTIEEALYPDKNGWSFIETNTATYLERGVNQMVIHVDIPTIPNIEKVEIYDNNSEYKSKESKSNAYDKYIKDIDIQCTKRFLSGPTDSGSGLVIDSTYSAPLPGSVEYMKQQGVPYEYCHEKDVWFGYTFYTTAYFQQGQQVSCSSNGYYKVKHIMEILSSDLPDKHSWSATSNKDGVINMTLTIPYSDTYLIRVRTYKNRSTSFCDLNINDAMIYEKVPICTSGVTALNITKAGEYNYFTSNTSGDPIIWLNQRNLNTNKIIAYNDNYMSTGIYDWDRNARVKKVFSSMSYPQTVLISSASSFNPTGHCDIYMGCKTFDAQNLFKTIKIKGDDFMESAPATPVSDNSEIYNCFSWSGGISSYPEYIISECSDYYLKNRPEIESFDNFYSSERYSGCSRYTRDGAFADNSVVDLWGIRKGVSFEFTHASITNNSDQNFHGYDWESKCGFKERIFHPRYGFDGSDIYGNVFYRYRISDSLPIRQYSLEQSIADDKTIAEMVDFNPEELDFIYSKIESLSHNNVDKFEAAYQAWRNELNESAHSNIRLLKQLNSYQILLNICREDDGYLNLIYSKIDQGDYCAIPLFEDLIIVGNQRVSDKMEEIRNEHKASLYDNKGRRIVRTMISNAKLLTKYIIASSIRENAPHKTKGSSHKMVNSDPPIVVHAHDGFITVSLETQRLSNAHIDLLDLNGNILQKIAPQSFFEKGIYQFKIPNPSNKQIYLIRCVLNGNLYIKKIHL